MAKSKNMEEINQKRAKAKENEQIRLIEMMHFEREAVQKGYQIICGIDEAGRGPLAGPVVAAAVVLPNDLFIEGVNDSKKLSEKKRESLFDEICEKAISFGIGIVDHGDVDSMNILNATRKAMTQAIEKLEVKPDILLIDAERLSHISIPQNSIIKGDAKSVSIAAASILAKVTRDRMMINLDELYPEYGFKKHKGYGTKDHIEAIKNIGICPIHRISFTKNFV